MPETLTPTMIPDDISRLRAYVDRAAAEGEDRLPAEPRLCEELGVSRGRLRTLLRRLEDEGLIWRHVGKGTFIGPRQASVEDAHWASLISVDDIMDARLLLEPQLAAQAAIHASPAQIATMDQCLIEMHHCETFIQWRRLDEKLHRTVAEATRNPLLLMLYDTLRSQMKLSLDKRMEEVFSAVTSPKSASDEQHAAFVDAIRRHDPVTAKAIMRDHLRSVRTSLFGLR